jgi:hypothetical protein
VAVDGKTNSFVPLIDTPTERPTRSGPGHNFGFVDVEIGKDQTSARQGKQ